MDQFHCHEALDRIHIAKSYLYMALDEHPFFNHPDNDDIKSILDKVYEQMEDIYQRIGERKM